MHTDYTLNPVSTFKFRGKIIGKLMGDTLIKKAKASIHMLRIPESWAVQTSVLNNAEELGGKWVCIEETENSIFYWATIAEFHSSGFLFDRGHGEQRALGLKHFQKLKKGERPSN